MELMRSINGPGRSLPSVRGTRPRTGMLYRCSARRPRGVRIGDASSDDETQPPSPPLETPCANPCLETEANREPSPREQPDPLQSNQIGIVDNDIRGEDVPPVPVSNQAHTRRGRGPAKCTEFEKLRKHGKVLLKINSGETAPCCENANMFTTRLSWIIKHHCNMSYPRWSDVPQEHKDELIDRVRGDFELDWDLENHQLAVTKQLRKRFNAFHHQLHQIYMSYGSHDEALATGTSLVTPLVWFKLCERWGSEAFQKIASKNRDNRRMLKINHTTGRKSFVRMLEQKRAENANLVDFYKETHWSKKKDKFVTPATEDIYKDMVGKLDNLEPDKRTDEAAAGVFREVLGHRPGYARGLGEMVIPESTRKHSLAREKEYIALIEKHKKEAEASKSEMASMKANMEVMMEKQNETDRMLRAILAANPSLIESLRETQ
ncbi:uncharacterized protein LOC121247400 [Juglans microcarpa x Juglans regia]|uniref:uncharacterized protein LOC121247400 n=1 Tax=Juglans microcarpa x Juglans regia TaxID=2249226 RepID=UPI001B7ECB91|nr:uncharacterized protein LOC121247400 [Juglans microcarpa x Juglans regia]